MPDEPSSFVRSASHGAQRSHAESIGRLLAAMLDEVDYPMLLVADGGVVVHANRTARQELGGAHPLRVEDRRLVARDREEAFALQQGLFDAIVRGRRRMLRITDGDGQLALSVVPLRLGDTTQTRAALLMLGKRSVCHALSLHWFARAHGLSEVEAKVVLALCEGRSPLQIAKSRKVSLSTVRTQIASARMKTGAQCIRDLEKMVLMLPPMVHGLGEPARRH